MGADPGFGIDIGATEQTGADVLAIANGMAALYQAFGAPLVPTGLHSEASEAAVQVGTFLHLVYGAEISHPDTSAEAEQQHVNAEKQQAVADISAALGARPSTAAIAGDFTTTLSTAIDNPDAASSALF